MGTCDCCEALVLGSKERCCRTMGSGALNATARSMETHPRRPIEGYSAHRTSGYIPRRSASMGVPCRYTCQLTIAHPTRTRTHRTRKHLIICTSVSIPTQKTRNVQYAGQLAMQLRQHPLHMKGRVDRQDNVNRAGNVCWMCII